MGIPNTFNGIVSTLAELAEDDSSEFSDYTPKALFLAQERLYRDIELQGIHAITTVTATPGSPYITKPSGYRLAYDVYFTVSGSAVHPRRCTPDYITDYWPNQSNTGTPKYYSDYSTTKYIVAPTPDSAYVFYITYTAQVSTLSSAVQTNYFTDNCADALFYGTMVNMAEFMKDYSTIPEWEAKYQKAVDSLNNQGRRERRGSHGPKNSNSEQNTLKGEN